MAKYQEGKLAPHEQATAAENHSAHGRTADSLTEAARQEDNREWRKLGKGADSRNRSANGCGPKANPRRNGRLMGATLTDRDFTGRPTAPAETPMHAAARWYTPTAYSKAENKATTRTLRKVAKSDRVFRR